MKRSFAVVLLMFFTAAACFAQTTINAASVLWPPFIDPDHPRQGLSLEIVRAAFETQGYSVVMTFMPWARAEELVRQGTYAITPGAWPTEDRKKDFLFSEPYIENSIKFIKRKGDVFEYRGLESLNGLVVGVVRGYGYDDAFLTASSFRREEANDFITNIRKLLARRIDITLEDEIVARYLLSRSETGLSEGIEFVEEPLAGKTLHVLSGLRNPRHREIIDAFNKGLAAIKADGTYSAILAAYGLK
jgi:polar amino acid transport system substrate-binding protein